MHPETMQLLEDENEYQRRLDAAEERARNIELEMSFLRVDIGAKNMHEEFVEEWYDDPTAALAEIVRMACLYNRAQAAQLGNDIMTMINDKLFKVAEITIDRRIK